MSLTKKIIDRILKSKVPKTATHFFHEGGYITFMKNKTMFKPKKLTKKEYQDFTNSQLKPFQNWSLK
jgi:hypothetical protein